MLFLGPGDIHSGYLKLILGLIWHLILKYQFVLFSPEVEEDPADSEQVVPTAEIPSILETVNETQSETSESKPLSPDIKSQTPVKDLLGAGSRSNSPSLSPGTVRRGSAQSPGTVRRGSAQVTAGATRRGSSQLTTSKAAPKISVKKVLLYYIQCCLPKMDIKNFTTDWCDGMALAGLIEHLKPNLIPGYDTFSPANALDNTKAAMDTAEKELKIPQVIKPVHLVEQPDELSLMTYLSYFCNSGSIGEKSLLEWINSKLHPHYIVTNFAVDWNNGRALGGLINACSPGLFLDHVLLDPENQLENVTRTLETASDKLGIDYPFTPQEMADCAVNKLYMMGYLTQYRFLETPSTSVPEPAATLTMEAPVETAISLDKLEELPPDATKVEMISEPKLEAGAPMDMEFDTADAGDGDLKASCVGDKAGEVDVAVKQKEDDKYSVSFFPPEPDIYTLTIKWAGEHVKGSPFKLNLQKPMADKVVLLEPPSGVIDSGAPINMVFGTKEAGRGTMTASCNGNNSGELPCTVTPKEDDKYDVRFVPPQLDVYYVDVKWSGEHVPGSPFKINLLPTNADKVEMVAEPVLESGAPMDMEFDTSKAGSGKLEASCVGDKVGEVDVAVTKKGDDKYNVSFTPPEPDVYHITIKWSGKHVPGSPFKLNLQDPVADNVELVEAPSATIRSGTPLNMVFSAEEAGVGTLTAACYGDVSGEIPCTVTSKGGHKYDVKFLPPQPDVYHVDVKWSGEHVPGSPFKLNLFPPVASNVKIVAEPEKELEPGVRSDILSFDTSDAGGGELDTICVGNKVGKVPVEVTPIENGKYNITFTPPAPDMYVVSVKWGGEHVKGSPFHINMLQPVAKRVRLISLPATSVEPGEPLSVGLDTSKAGEGVMEATCIGEKSGEVACSIEPNEDDKSEVKVSFTPPQPDVYGLEVMWSGEHVVGSPFKINLLPPVAENVEMVAEPETALEAGVPTDLLSFDTSAAGGGKLDAVCVGRKVGEVPVEVTPAGDDKFNVTFTPPEPDVYEISVKWAGEHVKGSPFIINMVQPVASRVRLVSPPSDNVEAGAPLSLGFDTAKAGEGIMEASCIANESGSVQCSVEPDKNNSKRITVSFVPPQPDVYSLSVTWSGDDVPGSTFKINLLPPVPDNVEVVAEPETGLQAGVPTDILSFDTSAAGGGKLDAVCTGSKVGDVPVEVTPAGDDKYRILFTPPEPDIYEVSVTWAGEHVKGSPFKIDMLQPLANKVRLVSSPSTSIKSGEAIDFGFDVSKAGQGTMKALCTGDKSGPLDCSVQPEDQNTVNVSFVPPQPDVFHLNVKWSGEDVPGSPYKVNLLPPVAEKVELVKKPPVQQEPGDLVDLDFDTSGAGSGELQATCVGSKCGNVPVEVLPVGDDKYKIHFIPPEPDVYEVSVKWAGEHVRGSPFKINTRPPSPVSEHVEMVETDDVEAGLVLDDFYDEDEDRALEEEIKSAPLSYYIGQVFHLGVDHEEGEEGDRELTVDCKGKETGRASFDVFRNVNDTYTVQFEPTVPDRYTLSAQMDGEHIPGSPFVIDFLTPIDPSKCKVSGLPTRQPQVNSTLRLTVDCSEAGSAELAAKADGPPEEVSEVKVNPKGNNRYSITYTPTTVGVHAIHIEWDEVPLPCSPLVFDVSKEKVEAFPHGGPITLDIDVEGTKLKNITSYAIHEPTNEKIKVTVKKADKKDQVKLTFKPKLPGIYNIHIFAKEEEIPDSPLKVKYSKPFDPNAVKVEVLGSEPYFMWEPIEATVDCKDAGLGNLSVKSSEPDAYSPKACKTTDNEDDTYSVIYVPTTPGEHRIDITWSDKIVKDSPLRLQVFAGGADCVRLVQVPGNDVQLGTDIHHVFDCSNAGKGTMEVTCVGQTGGEQQCTVEPNRGNDKLMDVHFTPFQEDIYHVHVKWSGDKVPGSPFKVNLLPPVAEKVEMVSHSDNLETGAPVDLDFDTSEAGGGTLDTACLGKQAGDVSVIVKPLGDDKYRISFTPPQPDTYEITIKWGGEHVKGSPFKIDVMQSVPKNVKLLSLPSTSVKSGEPLTMVFDTSKAGTGTMEATCNGKKAGEVPCSVVPNKDDSSKIGVSFTPPQPDIYHFKVTWSGDNVPGSPFKISLLPPVAENVKVVTEPETALQKGVDSDFLSFDTSDAGGGKLDAVCIGRKVGKVPVEVLPDGDDKYRVEFDPPEPDIFDVSVKWGGEHVKGSPFTINMLKPIAHRVKLVTLPSTSVEAGEPLSVTFDTRKAGEGVLEATCSGENCGEVACSLDTDENNTNRIKVSFVPPQPEVYHMNVTWSGVHVPGSPFKINLLPPVAENVEVTEPEAALETGADILNIDTSAAGGGKLEAACVGSKVGEVPVEVTPAGDDKFNIQFTPPEPDMYEVSVLWGGEHVKGSPFKIDMLKPKARKVLLISPPSEHVQVGAAVNLVYDTTNAGKGVMEASCTKEATKEDVPCTVQPDKDDSRKVTVSFVPLQPDVYHLSVMWSGEHVPKSPYKINLLPPVIADEVDTKEQAVVEAEIPSDVLGIDAPPSGADLETSCVGSKVGEVPVEVTPAGDDKYTILFNPPEPDLYEVTVKYEGKHVKGSPFKINTLRPDADKVKLVLPPTTNVSSGEPITMAFDTADAGNGRLEANCNGEASGTVKCTVDKDKVNRNQMNVSFLPPQHDIYHISVKWSGVHVPRSPFKINMLPTVAGRVRVITEPPSEIEKGSPVEMELDASDAGGGQLSVTCTGTLHEMPVEVERQKPGVYKVSFTPVDPDSYELNVKWGGKHIRGSPFCINMLPSNDEDSQPAIHKLEFEPSAVEDEPELDIAAPIESSTRVLPPNLPNETEAEETIQEFIYGHPVELYTQFVSVDAKHKNVNAHAVNQETNEKLAVTVKKFDRDHNKLVFKPKVPGIYHVHVFVNQEEISTSPYKIKYRKSFNTTAVKMRLLDSEPYTVGERVKLMIDCTEAGKGNLSIKAIGPAFGSKPKCEVVDNNDGTYLVTYLLSTSGKYKIEVSESGKPVAGSPVKVKVVHSVPERVTLTEPLPSSIKPAWTTSLNFTTSRAGNGKLSASCVGEECGKVPCDITDHEDTATVSFTPPQPDIYHLDVKWSGSHVQGSPFKLTSSDDAET